MTDYTMTASVAAPYDETVAQVRERLADQGFGVLTEIDVRATMKTKLDVDVASQVILGACRPQLAHRAMTAVPSIAALLPCNVVVREVGEGRTLVEAVDPDTMVVLAGSEAQDDAAAEAIRDVAREAKERLAAALAALTPRSEEN